MMVTCFVYFVTNLKILCASIVKFFIFGANGTSWIYILTALLFELVVFLNNSTMYQPIHGILLLTVICTFNSFVSYWESLLKKRQGVNYSLQHLLVDGWHFCMLVLPLILDWSWFMSASLTTQATDGHMCKLYRLEKLSN